MRNVSLAFAMLAFVALACSSSVTTSGAADKDGEGKSVVVELDGLSSKTPATWKEEAPANRMRYAQFKLPRVKGDTEDAELVIFKGFGGSAKANIDRWKQQFVPPQGKELDDVSKVTEIKVSDRPVTYLDITGTYLFKAQPFNPNAKTERKANYRLLGIHFEGKKEPYHIKVTGPAATVEHYKKGFDEWLKDLK